MRKFKGEISHKRHKHMLSVPFVAKLLFMRVLVAEDELTLCQQLAKAGLRCNLRLPRG